jgi:hypothetical protein
VSSVPGLVDWSRVTSFLALTDGNFNGICQRKSVQSSLQRNVVELTAEMNGTMRDDAPDMILIFS